ncbi:MAG: PhzF family phenazine biosynthesis isomerase [Acidobacteria bacterium]|nr:PhzF family phenazine biosynthesis isomerase [Acidobacteriota bacterium]
MKTFIVDSFTDKPFRGNPAGVCLPQQALSDDLMLSIAQELNLSETAFIMPKGEKHHFGIRYFSPKMEIALCGHATLASARVAFSLFGSEEAHFFTAAGIDLKVEASAEGISMVFPVYETRPASAPPALLAALGIGSVTNSVFNQETRILMLEIEDTGALADLQPDYSALYASHDAINGVLVTAQSHADAYDFHSRYFWPWSGTNEDPVTGGTHTFLAKYWSERLGKTKMRSYQSSKRSGFMEVELVDDQVVIRSQAIIVLEGMMSVRGE